MAGSESAKDGTEEELECEEDTKTVVWYALAPNDVLSFVVAAEKIGLIPNSSESETRSRFWDVVKSVEERYGQPTYLIRMAFASLVKHLLGPCVESLVLVDRVCYVAEEMKTKQQDQGAVVRLLNLYEMSLSPRNMVLLAEKGNKDVL
ncbi:hypothetical protein HK104_004533 [Borealophlyctis nickersoniae]|nr:hypothetical protein HK104_004533 [Borealophlyctis nickersoniae]